MEELLNVKQTARFLGVHKHHLYRLCRNRQIPHLKIKGVGLRFNLGELKRWIQEGKVVTIDWDEKVMNWAKR